MSMTLKDVKVGDLVEIAGFGCREVLVVLPHGVIVGWTSLTLNDLYFVREQDIVFPPAPKAVPGQMYRDVRVHAVRRIGTLAGRLSDGNYSVDFDPAVWEPMPEPIK